jgi:hypothetical protein
VTPRRLLLLVLLLTLPLVTPKIRGADEIQYFSYLRSAAFDRDLEFGNEYAYFYARDPQGLAGFKATFLDLREPGTGRHINFAPLGSALLWSPFYAVAHLGVLVARALGSGIPADGLSWPYVAAACYASWLYGLLGLLLIHDGLVRFGAFPERIAALSVGALALASPALYYLSLAPGFSHATSLGVVALLLWFSLRAHALDERGPALRLGDWALLGILGGLAAVVREQDGLFLVVPGVLLLAGAGRARKLEWILLRGLVLGVCAFAVFSLQLLAYRAVNGRFGPSHLVQRKMTWSSPHFFEVLFDPGHGLFVWAPVLLLAAAGLVWLWAARRQALFGALLLGLLLQIWINGAVESWTQAGAFGSRRFVGATVLFAWGLAGLLRAASARVGLTACAVVLGALVWWNVSLMVQFGLKLMDRQRLEWPRVAVNQVTAVPPRLFRVGWLFLTDRESLLREGP